MPKMIAKVKILDEKAVVPTRAHATDSGFDLTMIGVDKIQGDVIFFKTGLSVSPPAGYYFEITPRSSISKLPLSLANNTGIVDESYRGEIIVAIRVLHDQMGKEIGSTMFPNGLVRMLDARPVSMSSIAELILWKKPCLTQMILRKRHDCEFQLVDELDKTERDDGGFGSTDKV